MTDQADITAAVLSAIPKPNRILAPVMWYGGKGRLARKIAPLIPPGKVYCEPYCGAASVFWHLKPRPVEVLNDLHSELITLYRVLQNRDQFAELTHRLAWTPYSRAEFRKALEMEQQAESLTPVDLAWAFFVRQNQGFSGVAETEGDWGRVFVSKRGMADSVNTWRGRLASLATWHDRLGRVQLDSVDALECIRFWDSADTVFYLDPPYPAETRAKGKRNIYRHEADGAHHAALVELLLTIDGQAVLSGYDTPLYAPLADAGWHVRRIETACHAAGRVRGSKLRGKGNALKHVARTEVLWVKSNRQNGELF